MRTTSNTEINQHNDPVCTPAGGRAGAVAPSAGTERNYDREHEESCGNTHPNLPGLGGQLAQLRAFDDLELVGEAENGDKAIRLAVWVRTRVNTSTSLLTYPLAQATLT